MPEDKLIEAMARAIERNPLNPTLAVLSTLAAIEQEGYVVVPQAPDKIMIEKGLTAIQDNMDSTRDTYGSYDYAVEGTAYHCYVAMLAATKDPSNA